jgi:hypothetical protein
MIPGMKTDPFGRAEPVGQGWRRVDVSVNRTAYAREEGPYEIYATSTVHNLPAEEGGTSWIVVLSVTHRRRGRERARDHHVDATLAAFGMKGAVEFDAPGNARVFVLQRVGEA